MHFLLYCKNIYKRLVGRIHFEKYYSIIFVYFIKYIRYFYLFQNHHTYDKIYVITAEMKRKIANVILTKSIKQCELRIRAFSGQCSNYMHISFPMLWVEEMRICATRREIRINDQRRVRVKKYKNYLKT